MKGGNYALILLTGSLALASCATPYGQGMAALRLGRYEEAASHFEEALAQHPSRLSAVAGLGIARYKLGAFDEAVEALSRVTAHAPGHMEARLYLGLSYLRKGEDDAAEEQLTVLARLKPHPRLATQIDRALKVLGGEYALSEEMRSFLAASLEHEVEWEREVREAQLARPAYVEPFGFHRFVRCFRDRHGRLICL